MAHANVPNTHVSTGESTKTLINYILDYFSRTNNRTEGPIYWADLFQQFWGNWSYVKPVIIWTWAYSEKGWIKIKLSISKQFFSQIQSISISTAMFDADKIFHFTTTHAEKNRINRNFELTATERSSWNSWKFTRIIL